MSADSQTPSKLEMFLQGQLPLAGLSAFTNAPIGSVCIPCMMKAAAVSGVQTPQPKSQGARSVQGAQAGGGSKAKPPCDVTCLTIVAGGVTLSSDLTNNPSPNSLLGVIRFVSNAL